MDRLGEIKSMAGLKRICASAGNSRILIALLLIMGALTLSACGGSGGGSSTTSLSDGGSTADGSDDATTDDVDETVTATGVQIGNGTGADFVEGVVGASDTNLLAGGTTTLRINFVDLNNDSFGSEVEVDLTSNCFANGIAEFGASSIVTNSGGFGTTTYTANGCSGDDEIVATATVDEEVLTASVTLTIEADQVLGLSYEGATSTGLNLAGTGGTETTQLSFRLIGAQGASIVGESVSFTIQGDEGDATLAEGTESDVSDNSGIVTTVLQSGTVATNIRVTATHDNTLVSATSDSIPISSGLPIQSSFSLSQDVFNPPNTLLADGVEVIVSILAGDQFGNVVTEGTVVSFFAECGVIEPSCVIDEESSCSVIWRSNTASLVGGDARCSILAFSEGVESFTDMNGNFVYESVSSGTANPDIFDINTADLPEPFLDENENGMHDAGEPFVDTANGTVGEYDIGNDLWDGQCLAGIVPNADCEGDDSAVVFTHGLVTITCDAVGIVSATPSTGSTIDISGGASSTVEVSIQDGCTDGNPPSSGTTLEFSGDGVEVVGGASQVAPSNLTDPATFRAIVRGDDTPGAGELTLEITPTDGVPFSVFWTVID